jgi:colicin import membrane protein
LKGHAKEAQRLSAALTTSAADREELLQTLLACRKALARVEGEFALSQAAVREAEGRAADERVAAEELAGEKSSARGPEEARARALQLQVLLESERRAAREARRELTEERAWRTDAEMVLRAAIGEARAEVEAARAAVMRGGAEGLAVGSAGGAGGGPPATKPSRAALLADLLARDAVLAALPAVVFPSGHHRTAADIAKKEAAAAAGVAAGQQKK